MFVLSVDFPEEVPLSNLLNVLQVDSNQGVKTPQKMIRRNLCVVIEKGLDTFINVIFHLT